MLLYAIDDDEACVHLGRYCYGEHYWEFLVADGMAVRVDLRKSRTSCTVPLHGR